ncbi:hypothetical protein AB0451_33915 [Streptomyces sp. NPDC052000]|uniref:hypothetical protein n=1 Tax=Streptomyces sp. NPDC052000 TaxID=3155676 RepID=UPI003450D927
MALYRAAGGKRTCAAVAADVGVTGETLRSWERQADEQAGRGRGREGDGQAVEGRDEGLARLRAENGRLRKAEKEWEFEREILRRAAAYWTGEVGGAVRTPVSRQHARIWPRCVGSAPAHEPWL